MILISFTLALIAVVAGMMLLAQTKKDNLGNFFKIVAWFVIVLGFLSVLCAGTRSIARCHYRGEHCLMMMNNERCMEGYGMMGYPGCMMGGCGMMMNKGCYGGMMNGNCNQDMGQCKEGMNGQCHEGMGQCHEGKGEGSCPMMHGQGMMNKHDSTGKKM